MKRDCDEKGRYEEITLPRARSKAPGSRTRVPCSVVQVPCSPMLRAWRPPHEAATGCTPLSAANTPWFDLFFSLKSRIGAETGHRSNYLIGVASRWVWFADHFSYV